MAHFAQINEQNVVERVLRVPDQEEARGEAFLRDDLGLGGRWLQTSYSGSVRARFAGPGMVYSGELDLFHEPQPYPSWTLDAAGDWQPPVPRPDGDDWRWDEAAQTWIEEPVT